MLGVGVILSDLVGNKESVGAYTESLGKEITVLNITEDRLLFHFTDDSAIKFFDDGQSCCEHRYMHTDDELQDFVGSLFQGAEIRDGPEEGSEWDGVKESQFLVITTSMGLFTVVNYNEHNGYYGGFALRVAKV